MAVNEKKIVLWCGSGANQKALANKLAARYKLAGIVIDEQTLNKKPRKWTAIPGIIIDRLRFRSIYKAWQNLLREYLEQYPDWPETKICRVPSINDAQTILFTSGLQPDLILVSGTGMVKSPVLDTPATIGIINLHTGLSPYVKGAPNCTNWCIAKNEWHLVGNTIMWLSAGIDAGNIITTETTAIRECGTLLAAHRQVMNHAHDLYLRAVEYLLNSAPPYPSVAQSTLGKGSLYLNKMWTSSERIKLLKNWKNRQQYEARIVPQTIPLPA